MTKIAVRPEHISRENSTPYQGESCMVANAIREQLQIEKGVTIDVQYDRVHIGPYGGGVHVELPANVSAKIKRWDNGADTRPFEFELDLPKDWRKQVREAKKSAETEEVYG